jgi:cytochrome c-type biogenesis protein CcmH
VSIPTFPRRPAIRLAGLLVVLALCAPAAAYAALNPGTALPAIERQVMCVTCKIPLNVAESPQANREREYIEELIHQGESEAQIKQSMVAQYGPAVLGLPSTHGFDLTVYLVPVLVVLALLGLMLVLLPRWRRRARAQAANRTRAPALSPADAARLDSDLARFD